MLNLKKSKVVTEWLLSYIAVILLPFTVSLFNYSVFFDSSKKQNASLTDFAVEYTTNNIENIMADIQKIYMDVTTQEELAAVLSVSNPDMYFKKAEVRNLLNYFEKMQSFGDEYSGFFLYVPETEYVLSNKGVIDSRTYFDVYYGGTQEDYDKWKRMLSTEEKGFFFDEMSSKKANENYIACMSKMPWNITVQGDDAVFCVTVPREQFFKKTDKAGWVANAETYIYDNKDRLLFDSNEELKPGQSLNELIEKLEDDQVIVSNHISLDTMEFNAVMVVSKSRLFEQVVSMKNLFLFSTIICIIASIILVIMLLKYNYKPLREIMGEIGSTRSTDEFAEIKQFIKSGILNNVKEKTAMRQMILSHLVKGTYNRHYAQEDLKKYGIDFCGENYLIIVLSVGDPEKYAYNSTDSLYKRFGELQLIITNVFEEIFNNDDSRAYVINIGDMFYCVINTRENRDANEFLHLARMGIDVLNKEFGLDAEIATSKIHEDMDELPEAYEEANSTLKLQITQNDDLPEEISDYEKSLSEKKDEKQWQTRSGLVDAILDYIYYNYQNPELNIDFLSREFNKSSSYLSQQFKKFYGESLMDFIHKYRILEAKEQLKNKKNTVSKIAQSVGYTNIRTFNRVFKKYEGITPTQYQEKYQETKA